MEKYYRILQQHVEAGKAEFELELLPDCSVYAGHFPGNPIAPGACNIEMIRQCTGIAMQREVRIQRIGSCKFMHLLRPEISQLRLMVHWEENRVYATIMDGEVKAMQMKMEV